MTARRLTAPTRSAPRPDSPQLRARAGVARLLAAAALTALGGALATSPASAQPVLWMGAIGQHELARFNLDTMTRDQFIDMSPTISYQISNVATDQSTIYLGKYEDTSFIKADGATGQIFSVGSYTGAPSVTGPSFGDGSWNPATNTLWRVEQYSEQLFETDLDGQVLHIYQVIDESGGDPGGLYGLEWANGVHYMTTRNGVFGYVTITSPTTAVLHHLNLTGLENLSNDLFALAFDPQTDFMYMSARAIAGDGVLYRFDLTSLHAEFVATGIGPVGGMGWFEVPPPGSLTAFGLRHEPHNGASLSIDGQGRLVVSPGPGSTGDEDVVIHVGDNGCLSIATDPSDDLSAAGQRLRATVRGTVQGVPDTLVSMGTIEGTGSSALLTVNFILTPGDPQRVRLYDAQDRLVGTLVVPNNTAFTLTSSDREQAVHGSRSNVKGNLTIPPEYDQEFTTDLNVTHPSVPGDVFHHVRRIQAQGKKGDGLEGVDVGLGKKPAGAGQIVISQEAADRSVAGSLKGLAAFAVTGGGLLSWGDDSVTLTPPPGGGPCFMAISEQGMPSEKPKTNPKKKIHAMVVPPDLGGTAQPGSYLTLGVFPTGKGKECPPFCLSPSVTQTKVPGPRRVAISADFSTLGSTTERVTLLLGGVPIGQKLHVGPDIGVAPVFATDYTVDQAEPDTDGFGDPVKNVKVSCVYSNPVSIAVGGGIYTADEIQIQPENPTIIIEAIDHISLASQGLGSITVTESAFEAAALLVDGLPVSLRDGAEAQIDLDTQGRLVLSGIGTTGLDGYSLDLGDGVPGVALTLPSLGGAAAGAAASTHDIRIGGDVLTLQVQSAAGGMVAIQPQYGGTMTVLRKGLAIYSGPVAAILAPDEPDDPPDIADLSLQMADAVGTTLETRLAFHGPTTITVVGGPTLVADEIVDRTTVGDGALLLGVDYTVVTPTDPVLRSMQALLAFGGVPITGLGEAKIEVHGGVTSVTGLTDGGDDGFSLKAQFASPKSGKAGSAQAAEMGWLPLGIEAPPGSSVTTTARFAFPDDPTPIPGGKKDQKRPDGSFDVTADFSALGSPTVHVEVLDAGVAVVELAGHAPAIGIAGAAPTGAGAGAVWRLGGEGACVSSAYPAGTSFIIDGQTYSGDRLIVGVEGGRSVIDRVLSLDITAVGYETFTLTGASVTPNPICLADLNDDGFVDFADYLDFLNRYDAQDLSVDFNQDGFVDFNDYLEFLNFYDAGC